MDNKKISNLLRAVADLMDQTTYQNKLGKQNKNLADAIFELKDFKPNQYLRQFKF